MLINYHDHDNIDGPKGVKISPKGKKQTSILNQHMKLSKQKGIFLLCPAMKKPLDYRQMRRLAFSFQC